MKRRWWSMPRGRGATSWPVSPAHDLSASIRCGGPCSRLALPPTSILTGIPLVADVAGTFYFKPEGPQILCSPADEVPSEPCDARPDELDIAKAIDVINAATTLDIRHVRSSWAGLRNFVADRTPVAGFDDEVGRFLLVRRPGRVRNPDRSGAGAGRRFVGSQRPAARLVDGRAGSNQPPSIAAVWPTSRRSKVTSLGRCQLSVLPLPISAFPISTASTCASPTSAVVGCCSGGIRRPRHLVERSRDRRCVTVPSGSPKPAASFSGRHSTRPPRTSHLPRRSISGSSC